MVDRLQQETDSVPPRTPAPSPTILTTTTAVTNKTKAPISGFQLDIPELTLSKQSLFLSILSLFEILLDPKSSELNLTVDLDPTHGCGSVRDFILSQTFADMLKAVFEKIAARSW